MKTDSCMSWLLGYQSLDMFSPCNFVSHKGPCDFSVIRDGTDKCTAHTALSLLSLMDVDGCRFPVWSKDSKIEPNNFVACGGVIYHENAHYCNRHWLHAEPEHLRCPYVDQRRGRDVVCNRVIGKDAKYCTVHTITVTIRQARGELI